MNTSLASMTFYGPTTRSRTYRKYRIELRRMKKSITKKDEKGNDIVYVAGLWGDGGWLEYLTQNEMKARLSGVTWDWVNPEVDRLQPQPV